MQSFIHAINLIEYKNMVVLSESTMLYKHHDINDHKNCSKCMVMKAKVTAIQGAWESLGKIVMKISDRSLFVKAYEV